MFTKANFELFDFGCLTQQVNAFELRHSHSIGHCLTSLTKGFSSHSGSISQSFVLAGNSEGGGGEDSQQPMDESPTTQLLQEYEMHLRNTLAKGMDAESYSLHTFEQLLTQSMENLGECLQRVSSVSNNTPRCTLPGFGCCLQACFS